jgi:hypothetical protein
VVGQVDSWKLRGVVISHSFAFSASRRLNFSYRSIENACTAFPSTLVCMLELSPPLPWLLLLRVGGLSRLNARTIQQRNADAAQYRAMALRRFQMKGIPAALVRFQNKKCASTYFVWFCIGSLNPMLFIYLTIVSMKTIQRRMMGWLINWKGSERKRSCTNQRTEAAICVKRSKNQCKDSHLRTWNETHARFIETNFVAWVRERTTPKERPPFLSEVSANFLRIQHAMCSAWRSHVARI